MAYEFHYTPTGTGVISGKEVLEQTEDAINDLGNTAISGVQEALDKAEQALTNSENAVDDAQTALNTANNAEGVAIQAQTDVSNLSGTVTNIGNRVTTAEGNIGNLQGRMTTAEGNITNLQGRMTTAEGNIGNLQTAVSTAQATANSAQQTATTARQQSYVFRYSSTALVASSTNANSLLDNTDNLKVGDKVIDSSGVLFSITAIDTANSTFTIGTALIDLAQDSDVVHKSGDETVAGLKTFENNRMVVGRSTDIGSAIQFINSDVVGDSANGESSFEVYGSSISDANKIGSITIGEFSNNGGSYATIECNRTVLGVKSSNTIRSLIRPNGSKELSATVDNDCKLGTEFLRWSKIYGTEYYYGNNNVEFSTKFVTTDTAQSITATKSFAVTPYIYNADANANIPNLYLRNQVSEKGNTIDSSTQNIVFTDKNNKRLSQIQINKGNLGETSLNLRVETTDNSNNDINSQINYYITKLGTKNFTANADNDVNLGIPGNKWKNTNTYLLNGLEPSSLSLPSGNLNDIIDISSYLTHLDGTINTYTAPANGWISITMNNCSGMQAYITGFWGHQIVRPTVGGIRFLMPILKNQTANILIFNGTIDNARFIPCQGNV